MTISRETLQTEAKRAGETENIIDFTPEILDKISVGQGSFGALDRQISIVEALREEVKDGNLTIAEFFDKAELFARNANQTLNNLTTAGGESATRAKTFLPRIRKFAKLDTEAGQGTFQEITAPFTTRESAQLPENVLPTREDIEAGILPEDLLPRGIRVREPVIEPDIDPETGEPVVAPPGVEDVPTGLPPDQTELEREGLRQAEQNRLLLEQQTTLRRERLGDLASLLGAEEERKFGLARPEIAEEAQAGGLLRSSGFGQELARERSRLAGQTAFQLGAQGLTDRDAEVLGLGDILGRRQEFQSGGLQRTFSLADFEREANLARSIGASAAPQVSRGGGAKGSSALAGAATGATVGTGAGGPGIGTAVGATIGAGAGLLAGGK